MKDGLKIEPEIVYHKGKPSKVILEIDVYEEMLERLEDQVDLEELRKRKAEPQTVRSFDEYLNSRLGHV
ncbi:MAG: type II toxin-antitoxin system Phd/YefM family antitoxin [bacterium]|nr:type II toxin-antitoxin system Phd/YefM family antitoxin [bacterium]